MENREIATIAQKTKWTEKDIATIKNTVAVGADDSELNMFLSLCSKYDLDPFAREIWFLQMKGRNVITTSRDGYLKIANRNPHYKGMASDVVYQGDKFLKTREGVQHSYGITNRGKPIGAYAYVMRDDRTIDTYFFAPMSDYNKSSGVWQQYPHAMILKVAEAMALKRAFSISGLVTEEEIGTAELQKPQAQPQLQAEQKTPPQPTATKSDDEERKTQLNQLYHRYLDVCGGQKNHAFNAMKLVTGKASSAEYTDEDIEALFADVIRREDEKMNAEVAERFKREYPEAAEILDAEELSEISSES